MPRRHQLLLLLVTPIALLRPALALEWKTTDMKLRPEPMQSSVEISFAYTNTSAKPVAIRDVQTNCGCIEAASDRPVCPPGETGHIQARFIVGDRFGVYERIITVVTDDSPTPTHLHVSIDVPELAIVTPRSLEWSVGGASNEQLIEVRATSPLEIEFQEATPTNEYFLTRLECVEPGRLYRVYLKPTGTTTGVGCAVRIVGREKSGRAVLVSAYGLVK